jgi:hypothetical protein
MYDFSENEQRDFARLMERDELLQEQLQALVASVKEQQLMVHKCIEDFIAAHSRLDIIGDKLEEVAKMFQAMAQSLEANDETTQTGLNNHGTSTL